MGNTCTVNLVFKMTREIATTWEFRTATSFPRPIQYREIWTWQIAAF